MTPRRLLILGALAILAVAVGLWLSYRTTSSHSAELNEALYASLQKELDDVTAVRIYQAGDVKAVELQRSDTGWTVAERSGYPADVAKLRRLLVGIAEAKVIEEKTSNPENYAALGVQDITAQDATGLRVEVVGASVPVNVIVGKTAPGGSSHYVRRAGEPQSWLVDTTFDTSASADAWLSKEIVDVASERIQSATVALRGAKSYSAAKQTRDAANFSVDSLPKGKELSSASAANTFGTALTSLTLTDVRPARELSSDEPDASADFETFDGLVVHVEGWQKEDKHYIAVKSEFDAEQAQRFATAESGEDGEGGKSETTAATPSAAQPAPEKVREEAQAINERVTGWAYEIPEYKYDAIFKPLDQLLKK